MIPAWPGLAGGRQTNPHKEKSRGNKRSEKEHLVKLAKKRSYYLNLQASYPSIEFDQITI